MEIPLQAQVECTDGVCGLSVYVLINPLGDEVSSLVVKETSSGTEYIVPVDVISATIADTIQLRCTKAEFEKMDLFVQTEYITETVPDRNFTYMGGVYGVGSYYYMPYITHQIDVQVPVERQQIPLGEFAIRRGTRVEATDGYVGKVDEFVVNQKDGHITHLVMREGHLWGKKDVIIPVSAMGETREDTVFLKLDKHQMESLPAFPVNRHWA